MLEKLKDILIKNQLSISVAESCTGGNLQSLLTSVNGSSGYFNGGITTYNIDTKCKHLNVDYEVAEPVDCISQEVANQMAYGVIDMFESVIGISTTGYIDKYLYYCIVHKHDKWDTEVLDYGKIEIDSDNRSKTQKKVSKKILKKLLEILDSKY